MITPTAGELAAALEYRQVTRGRWRGPCILCGGTRRGQISEGDSAPLVFCFVSCRPEAIITELRRRGLWPAAERRELTPEERRRWAEAKQRAAAAARLAGAWLSERLRELEEEKAAAVDLNGGQWDTLTLAAAAREQHHLSTLDAAGVLKAWKAARELDPAHTKELERIGLEWQAACERMAGMLAGFIQKGAAADAA